MAIFATIMPFYSAQLSYIHRSISHGYIGSSLGDLFRISLDLSCAILSNLLGSVRLLWWGLCSSWACAVALVGHSLGMATRDCGLLVRFGLVELFLVTTFAEASGVVGSVFVHAQGRLGLVATFLVAEVAHEFSPVSVLMVLAHIHRIEGILDVLV